jgi:hypothetical protein
MSKLANAAAAATITAVALLTGAALAPCSTALAQTVAPFYAANYSIVNLGTPAGVPANLGGINFLDNNTLLIGGNANGSSAAIYRIGLTRNAQDRITGFNGAATLYAPAPNIDGGLFYMPNGTLAFTTFSNNNLGQFPTGLTTPTLTPLSPLGVASSTGTGTVVPPGFPGAGNLIVGSYSASIWYRIPYNPNPNDTYSLSTAVVGPNTGGGPEGIVYVPTNSALFGTPSVLISEFSAGAVRSYLVDSSGFPRPDTRRDFITGLSGAEGGVRDPVTGEFLFSTFGGGNRVLVVRGFAPPLASCGLGDVAGPGQVPQPDNELTADDIIVFISWFTGRDPRADIAGGGLFGGGDGEFTADDVVLFVQRFTRGC